MRFLFAQIWIVATLVCSFILSPCKNFGNIALNNKIFKHHYNDFKMKNSHIFYLLINKIFTVH